MASRAQQLKNPGLRSKLPMSALTPKLQRQRRLNTRIAAQNTNPLYDPSVMLSGHALASAASAMSDATYQPQIADIQRQQGSATAQGSKLMSNAGDYYHQLAAQEAAGITREAAIGKLLQQQQGTVGAQTQGAFQQMSSDEAARQAADQAVRGGGLGGTGGDQVAAAIAGGQGRSAQYQQAAQNSSAEQAANWEALANANLQARQVHGGEIQGQLANSMANTNRTLQGKLTDLQSQRANDVAKNVLTLRQQGFTNAATLQGLGIKSADLAASIQKANQSNATANRRISSSAHQQSANRSSRESTAAANRASADQRAAAALQAKQAAAAAKHVTDVRSKAGKAWAPVDNVLGQASGAQVPLTDASGNPTGKTRPATTAETIGALRAKKVPEWAIQAAVSIRHHGFLTPEVIRLIHQDAPDVRIPGKYRPPVRSKRLSNRPT